MASIASTSRSLERAWRASVRTLQFSSLRAATRASTASGSPISPRAQAAAKRTSPSVSRSLSDRGSTALRSFSRTRASTASYLTPPSGSPRAFARVSRRAGSGASPRAFTAALRTAASLGYPRARISPSRSPLSRSLSMFGRKTSKISIPSSHPRGTRAGSRPAFIHLRLQIRYRPHRPFPALPDVRVGGPLEGPLEGFQGNGPDLHEHPRRLPPATLVVKRRDEEVDGRLPDLEAGPLGLHAHVPLGVGEGPDEVPHRPFVLHGPEGPGHRVPDRRVTVREGGEQGRDRGPVPDHAEGDDGRGPDLLLPVAEDLDEGVHGPPVHEIPEDPGGGPPHLRREAGGEGPDESLDVPAGPHGPDGRWRHLLAGHCSRPPFTGRGCPFMILSPGPSRESPGRGPRSPACPS